MGNNMLVQDWSRQWSTRPINSNAMRMDDMYKTVTVTEDRLGGSILQNYWPIFKLIEEKSQRW